MQNSLSSPWKTMQTQVHLLSLDESAPQQHLQHMPPNMSTGNVRKPPIHEDRQQEDVQDNRINILTVASIMCTKEVYEP